MPEAVVTIPGASSGTEKMDSEIQKAPEAFTTCCKEMELLEFPDKFVVRSVDPHAPDLAFSINRSDGLIQPLPGDSEIGAHVNVSTIYGVIGTIRLVAGMYVLVITSREEITGHLGGPIYLVKSMNFLSCNGALVSSSCQEKSDEAYFRTLLKTVETTPGLYYSYEVDLTVNFQRSWKLAKERTGKPLWKQADPRFVWNRNMLEDLIEYKLDQFIIPVIQGSIQNVEVLLKELPLRITLISRRCTRRLGTRMWRRGANLEGDVANFVETEQVVEFDGYRSSFLQIRGSIPLLWEQIVDLSYKPQFNVISHEETRKVVERHFHDLSQRYGQVVAVDLTDKHGDEGQLSNKYAFEMQSLQHVRYVSFDFHHYYGNGHADNLLPLFENICNDIVQHGYFMLNMEGELLLQQRGIMRINCIDCLDRTNVTQCYLGRKSLDMQLQTMGIFTESDSISMYPEIYENFKILWVNHGDEISLEYSGTHALKGDLVRFGRQTISGIIKDGMSALSRYYINNFQDGTRQDAIDLISGRYSINRSAPSPFQLNGFESVSYLPIASAAILGGFTLTTCTMNQAARNSQQFVSSVLWAGLTAGVVALVKANGRQFCSRPRLCKLL